MLASRVIWRPGMLELVLVLCLPLESYGALVFPDCPAPSRCVLRRLHAQLGSASQSSQVQQASFLPPRPMPPWPPPPPPPPPPPLVALILESLGEDKGSGGGGAAAAAAAKALPAEGSVRRRRRQ